MKRIIGGDYTDQRTELEAANDEISYQAAVESMVLLRNDGALPLKSDEVWLFGAGACYTIKGGTGSGEVNNRHSVSIYEGLENAGIRINSESYIQQYIAEEEKHHQQWIKDNTRLPSANNLAGIYQLSMPRPVNDADLSEGTVGTAIYVISRQSGEGADKRIENHDYDLTALEINDICFLNEKFEHLIVVINSGSSMDLSALDEMSLTIVFFGQAGQRGGDAFADLIRGKRNFSGKLSTTWAKRYSDIPFGNEFSYLNGNTSDEYYREGIYVGYRYFDSFDVEPRFHFGHGLSYTEFDISLTGKDIKEENIKLEFRVKNTGDYPGKETVQVYTCLPQGNIDKEYKRLVAFSKTSEIAPGQEETVSVEFTLRDLASYFEKEAEYIVEKGEYVLLAGDASNRTEPILVVEMPEDFVVSIHDNVLVTEEKIDELRNISKKCPDIEGVERVPVNTSKLETKRYKYGKPDVHSEPEVDRILNQLNEKELTDIVCGIGTVGMLDTNIFCAPGSAGKTTYKYLDKGLLSVNLADGPSGLRLIRKAAVGRSGRIKMFKGNYLLSMMDTMPSWLLWVFKPGKKDTVFYQNTTAFPVGVNLAQTWNRGLIEEVGQAVSREMDKFNITYWLAPGMNIMKNPLCGRNFEYYSEDPVLSGKIAAAITRGVQKIEGNYTTIKHFACNNVEDNRYHSNSHVSQRALREIYLRGFEINIREAKSGSVMTSYNMINGVYAPDSYDLCTKILRNEWGFEGVVMTDWFSTREGQGHTDLAIAGGNDMIMPGGRSYKKTILNGLKNGTVSLEDLRRAAANIIRSIVHSNVAGKHSSKDFK